MASSGLLDRSRTPEEFAPPPVWHTNHAGPLPRIRAQNVIGVGGEMPVDVFGVSFEHGAALTAEITALDKERGNEDFFEFAVEFVASLFRDLRPCRY